MNQTQSDLATTQEAYRTVQRQLSTKERSLKSVRDTLNQTQRELTTTQEAHRRTQGQLNTKERSLKSVRDTLNQTKKKYDELLKIKEPIAFTYFELGRAAVELGIMKEEARKIKEAVNLYTQARGALEKAVKGNEASEVHYYLAEVYYGLAKRRLADFKDACHHAKRAIALAPGRKHKRAEALKEKIENCK